MPEEASADVDRIAGTELSAATVDEAHTADIAKTIVADIASWWTPQARCDKTRDFIEAYELEGLIRADDERVIVLDDHRGLVTYRPAIARIRWLLADPAHFTAIAERLCALVQADIGEAPWGCVMVDATRKRFLQGAFRVLPHDEMSKDHVGRGYPDGMSIIYTGG